MRASAADPKVSRLGADKGVSRLLARWQQAKQLREKSQMELVGLLYIVLGALVILTTVTLGLWDSTSSSREALPD
jgi:uncharacterized membrane protein YjgN (DUF898 family)